MRTLVGTILLGLLTAIGLFAQSMDDQVLATVGNKKITVKDFKERYQLTPQVGRHIKDSEPYLKMEMLYSIIAEKLWALEAEKVGLDTSEIMTLTFKNVEQLYMRDALYSKEIKEKREINPYEYQEARQRSATNILTSFIFSKEENDINNVYSALKAGAKFDSLLATRPEVAIQDSLYVVQYGQMEKYAEDVIYKLKEGDFSEPLKAPNGWYIFKVRALVPVKITNANQVKAMEKNIHKKVEERATNKAYDTYTQNFFRNKEVEADGKVFWCFAESVTKVLIDRQKKEEIKLGEKITLESEDYYSIEKEIGKDTLNMVIVKFQENPVTLKEFLRHFVYEGFYSNSLDINVIAAKLNSRLKIFIEHELLSREAKKRGLDKSPVVAKEISMWRDNYMGTLYKGKLAQTVKISDEEVLNYYKEKKGNIDLADKVNIVEVLTDSLEIVEKIFQELDAGKDFRDLAIKYTKRDWVKKNNGEFGFFPTTDHGEIGRIAGDLKIGEIYGPLEVEEGYSIFKVIDKKKNTQETPKSFDELKDELKKQLVGEKMSEIMKKKTIELANKYNLSVDENLLHKTNVTNLSMLVYRYMGFGGRILAVPLTPPFVKWVEEWQKQQELP